MERGTLKEGMRDGDEERLEGEGKCTKRGRKTKSDTLLLDQFESIRPPYARPKKEYLRIRVIRGFKRAIRQVHEKYTPRTKIHRVPENDALAQEQWTNFKLFVRRNKEELLAASLTTEGPNTEGVALRTSEEWTGHKCHTDTYCREFFKSPTIREGFTRYLDVVFSHEDDQALSQRFGFQAKGSSDSEKGKAWAALKSFLYAGMIADLDKGGKQRGKQLSPTLRPRSAHR